jgi:hypothetical protein
MAPNPITKALEVSGVLGIFPPVRAEVTWCSRHPDAWQIPMARVMAGQATAEQGTPSPRPEDDGSPNGSGPRLVV